MWWRIVGFEVDAENFQGQGQHPELGNWGNKKSHQSSKSLWNPQNCWDENCPITLSTLYFTQITHPDSPEPVIGTVSLFNEKWFDNVRQEKLAEIVRNARRCRRLTLSLTPDRLDLSLRSCEAAQGFVWRVLSRSSVLLIKASQFFSTAREPGNCLEQSGGSWGENTFAVRRI